MTSEVPTRVWSPQQEAIFQWFRSGSGHLTVEALAGTGKTTTIIEAINDAPEERILLCAFNRRIAEELQRRLSVGTLRAEAKTLHSIGYGLVRQKWPEVTVDPRARGNQLSTLVLPPGTKWTIQRLICQLCEKARELKPLAQSAHDLLDLAIEYDCTPEKWMEGAGFRLERIALYAYRMMEKATEPAPAIDYADMLFLPLRLGWTDPTYDLVVVDEAQDMTEPQLDLALGLSKGRIALVGDSHQAIYKFRGADSDALGRLTKTLEAQTLGLTTTYRCAKSIVALAQTLVPGLEAREDAPEGTIVEILPSQLEAQAAVGDFILSRINAPLVPLALSFLRAGKRCRIQGRDIGKNLKALATKIARGAKAETIDDFLTGLTAWEVRETQRARTLEKEQLINLIHDRAETLEHLAEGCASIKELEDRLEYLFADEGSDQIILSTVHKAKGLEARRVFLLKWTLEKFKGPEEDNIKYVAYTRAIEELVFVL